MTGSGFRPMVPLDPLLPVQLVVLRGDRTHIRCADDWTAWADGRCLVPVPQDPPGHGAPPGDAADPRPLLARAERALADYRAAVADLVAGGLDAEAFRDRTRGLRIGVLIDGASMWLYDAGQGRWLYVDGGRLSTRADDRGQPGRPPAGPDPAHAAAADGDT
ncbi:hypothetical protein ACQEV4_29585 [Streptomyces shenzhenensis]|uniref:hypothetical protein n=1 Tax=Streptomyces shenzhenensis TaxID=943815 RepID=UPI003D922593